MSLVLVTTSGDVSSTSPGPVRICEAGKCPLRVVVRNPSLGVSAFLSFDKAALLGLPNTDGDTYELPAGFTDEFVVMPGQILFAAATAAGVRICVAISPWISISVDKLT